ncbi:hypothetical protein [Rhodopirellula sallentina]|uniref:hypothetical protein n=1 Tax=Rhodopirellula sallentina TaxID=1263869 RepID=UPI00034CFAEF|nr:hypothetical protein [Rhodopirellula sallentina]
MTPNENVLSVVPGASEHQRLLIVHRSMDSRDAVGLFAPEQPDDTSAQASLQLGSRPFCEQVQAIRDRPIVLRQETFSPAVGWFTQSEMELTMQQWAAMKTTMLPGSGSESATGSPSRFASSRFEQKTRRREVQRSRSRANRVLSADGEVIALSITNEDAVPA